MSLIDAKAYQNAREKRKAAVSSLPFEIVSDSATEKGGRGGMNLQEMSADIDGVMPDDAYSKKKYSDDETDMSQSIGALVELGDLLDLSNEHVYAEFIDLIIKKIASDKIKSPVQKFNDLMIKIMETDIPDSNDAMSRLAKIFSRTIIVELSAHRDLIKAQESAYKKVLHRAEQFLSNGSMINKTANIHNNPEIVAKNIKNVIDVLVSRFSPESRIKAYPNLKSKITKLNPLEIQSKRSPGGAAIGVAISLIKNILNGRDGHFITMVISNLLRIL